MRGFLTGSAWIALAAAAAQPALAQQNNEERDTVFVLGRLEVAAQDSAGETLGGSTIGADAIRVFDKTSVDEALDLIPGASASNTGGSRNERVIYIRGFDRLQTTISIDGVRVFLPADNRIDFGRFMTADLAEIQVSKGYVSVLDGPGGLGGAVNLVTRKPAKGLEAELTLQATADREFEHNGTTVSALIGTRQDKFYLQASGASTEDDGFTLSDNFTPSFPALEDGGERVNSDSEDWRINLKAGWTPNDTDEYAVSYIKQSGGKNAPYHVYDTANARFWTWPYWDIESIYFLSSTQIGDALTLRSRIYRNTFENLLATYDNANQNTQSLPRAFDSYYADESWGAIVTLDWIVTPTNNLSTAFHYRSDVHNERQDGFVRTPPSPINPSANAPYSEPWHATREDTWSIAVEDRQQLSDALDLVIGASYDWTELQSADDINVQVTGTTIANSVVNLLPVNHPLRNMDAVNGQAALSWRLSGDQRLYASVSSRTRFPTLQERFSSRMGAAIPNPEIEQERSVNYEVGGETMLGGVELQGALFFSDLQDALVATPVFVPDFGTVSQMRNIADGEYYGAELSAAKQFGDMLRIGGNYTWLRREFNDPGNPNLKPQGVPEHKAFLYAEWSALNNLTVTPSVEFASERWTTSIDPAKPYYETGSYALLNLAVDWSVSDNVSVLLGGRNLTDSDYQLVDGFPEEGRSYSLSLRFRN